MVHVVLICVDLLFLLRILYVGLFYYTLLNIHPEHRSSLQNIQLITVVKQIHIKKYGLDSILEPFVVRIKELEKVRLILIF